MPRGNPGKLVALRLDPALLAAVKERTSNVTKTVEEGLRWWLARERRKAAKAGADPLARHLAPATARKIASRHKDDAA
jgi:hypothetical protein